MNAATEKTTATNDTAAPPPVSFAPLACPPLGEPLMPMHPRVFLTPDAQGQARCPYCGARYVLGSTISTHDHPPS